jgi:hypothetical protein
MSRSLTRMPTRFELSVAFHVARLIGPTGLEDNQLISSFERLGSGGLVRVDHLKEGTKLLAAGGLLLRSDNLWQAEASLATVSALQIDEGIIALAGLILGDAPPLWLAGATGGATLNSDLIPDEDWKACCDTISDPERREALLLSIGRRFEEEAMRGLDDLGVAAVVEACREGLRVRGRPELAAGVLPVARAERLGYDLICPSMMGGTWRLKVKTARRALPRLMLNVGREEILLGSTSKDWALVACVADPNNAVRISGWCNGERVQGHLPDDLAGRGEWATARLFLDEQDLSPGLPDLDIDSA